MIRRHWKVVALVAVLVLVAVRLALPLIMLKKSNEFLATYSQVFHAQIGDIDLSFIRMAYRFEQIEVKIRKDDSEILQVGSVDVSLAWRQLLKGLILSDIEISDARIKASPELKSAYESFEAENREKNQDKSPKERKEDPAKAESVQSKLFPLRIERIIVRDSSGEWSTTKDAPDANRLVLDQIQVRIGNVTPLKKEAKTVASFEARFQRNAQIKGVAQSRIAKNGMDWDVDAEMRDFELKYANRFLMDLVPFSFTRGKLDLFVEAKSENGALIGYVKPFLTGVDIIAREEDFESAKHFLAEIVVAIGHVLAQRPKLKSVATKVDFTKTAPEAEFKVDVLGALANTVEHRLDQAIAPSIEDEIRLK